MTAHRMISALLVLQQRGSVTAAELADELDVSVRTARRVLDALTVAGIPVYSRAGRGGGWSLVGGARTDLSGLTAAEARALFLIAGPSATASSELRDALRKLVQALPETFRQAANAAADATVIDTTRWGHPSARRPPDLLDPLRLAIVEQIRVEIGYTNRSGDVSTRTVSPLGVVDKRGVWYLVAATDQGDRTFRIDRISSLVPTDETFERPADFDLESTWNALSSAFEATWPTCVVDASVDPAWVGLIRHVADGPLERVGVDESGWVRVRIATRGVDAAAGQLAGFVGVMEIHDPPEVRQALARTGRQLIERYDDATESLR